MSTTPGSLQHNLNEFLRHTEKHPMLQQGNLQQLFLGRVIRTRLDLVRPEETNVKISQKRQATAKLSYREFQSQQLIYFLSGNPRINKWVPGVIITRLGDLHYEINYQGKPFKRHIDQIKRRWSNRDGYFKDNVQLSYDSRANCRKIHFYSDLGSQSEITPSQSPVHQQVVRPPRTFQYHREHCRPQIALHENAERLHLLQL